MKVLLIGSGAREHALAWSLLRHPGASLTLLGGNPGIAALGASTQALPADQADTVALARELAPDLVVIGPEAPLVAGLADALRELGLKVFGPGAEAAQLEGSKAFAKSFMQRFGVPTAEARSFDDYEVAASFVRAADRPFVVKADGLAAGKGVVVAATVEETLEALRACLVDARFGAAGQTVLLEERLEGEELSLHVLVAGEQVLPLALSQDHKRLGEGDAGPNTGGMGAYSPLPQLAPDLLETLMHEVVRPTANGLKSLGFDYRGVLFIGVMLVEGQPKVLEYNCRFGDPETEVLLPRLEGSIAPYLLACARGELPADAPALKWPAALTLTLASEGYPLRSAEAAAVEDAGADTETAIAFHAGTRVAADGTLEAVGGRVFSVTGLGANLEEAAARAYERAAQVRFAGQQYRRDIGHRAGLALAAPGTSARSTT